MSVSQEELHRLRTAFTMHALKVVAEADEIIDWDEVQIICSVCSQQELRALGFVDDEGRTTRAYAQAVERALEVLPREITLHDKLELITVLHRTSLADGQLDPREFDALCRAASLIDLSASSLAQHLDHITHQDRKLPPVRRS